MLKPTLFLTGGNGFVGSRVKACWGDAYEIVAPSHQECDITHAAAVEALFARVQPAIVVHCAALSNTWYCEQHPDESMLVNVEATVNLAQCCQRHNAKFIFISSDQVYNGTPLAGALPETAPLAPVNVYGQHKLLAEQRVIHLLPTAVGLRLTWMYDLPESPLRLNSNILVNLRQAAEKNTTLKVSTHEHRGFTHVWEVAREIEKTFTLPGGIYNFGCENQHNSYETFCQCAALMNLPANIVEPDNDRFADQPRNISMNTRLAQSFGITFPNSIEGFSKALG